MKKLMVIALLLAATGAAWGQDWGTAVTEDPTGCQAASSRPCKLTFANGNTFDAMANGTSWFTFDPTRDDALSVMVKKQMVVEGKFETAVAMDIPANDNFQSSEMTIDGNCQTQDYTIKHLAYYSGKMATGNLVTQSDPDVVPMGVEPDTTMGQAFSLICGTPALMATAPAAPVVQAVPNAPATAPDTEVITPTHEVAPPPDTSVLKKGADDAGIPPAHGAAIGDGLMALFGGSLVFLLLAIVAGLLLYMLPTLIARSRNHNNVVMIGFLNFFTGWTLLGWIGCLIWAVLNPPVQPGGRT